MRRALLVAGLLLLTGCGPAAVDTQPPVVASTPTPTPTPTPTFTLTPTSTSTPTQTTPKPTPRPPKPKKTAPVLQSNKLYAAGKVGAVKCPLPGDRLVSAPAVTRYVRAVLACLDQAWAPVVKRAGFRFHPPVLHIFKKTVESPCTGPSADAFYCGESDGIYLDWTSDQVLGLDQFNTQMDLIYTASHEYGHHIQELSGIMRYYDSHFDDKPYKAQLEESRRLELQADCFAAAFLRGNEQTLYLLGSRYWALNLGSHGDDNDPRSPRDHGSTNSNHRWAADTFASGGDLASCNTWTAPAEYVS